MPAPYNALIINVYSFDDSGMEIASICLQKAK